jgi:hypothetical protein
VVDIDKEYMSRHQLTGHALDERGEDQVGFYKGEM